MTLKFLGTGTSQGIPVIGCSCKVCTSKNPKDRRFRSSAMVKTDSGKKILIDCGPDFRMQMLENHENNVDAVLITHEHNDHVIGLDDMRPLIFKQKREMEIFSSKRVGAEIRARFPYAFASEKYPGAPAFELYEISNHPFPLFDTEVIPLEVMHYRIPVFGFRFRDLAYITDASSISDTEKNRLKNLEFLILNCIRKENPHPAHFILPDVLQLYEELKPKHLYLTHLSHEMGLHDVTDAELPEGVHLAYDGLELQF